MQLPHEQGKNQDIEVDVFSPSQNLFHFRSLRRLSCSLNLKGQEHVQEEKENDYVRKRIDLNGITIPVIQKEKAQEIPHLIETSLEGIEHLSKEKM